MREVCRCVFGNFHPVLLPLLRKVLNLAALRQVSALHDEERLCNGSRRDPAGLGFSTVSRPLLKCLQEQGKGLSSRDTPCSRLSPQNKVGDHICRKGNPRYPLRNVFVQSFRLSPCAVYENDLETLRLPSNPFFAYGCGNGLGRPSALLLKTFRPHARGRGSILCPCVGRCFGSLGNLGMRTVGVLLCCFSFAAFWLGISWNVSQLLSLFVLLPFVFFSRCLR
mmetsp:Transcript_26863/g.52756  ORF Transcript_26863/g.52756 Transcript_26863/m.52756 type:complete len:223 (+) Transcript_26863:170-838(+)